MLEYHENLHDLFDKNNIAKCEIYVQKLGFVSTEALSRATDDNLRKVFLDSSEFVEVWYFKQFALLTQSGWKWGKVLEQFDHCKDQLKRTGNSSWEDVYKAALRKLMPMKSKIMNQGVSTNEAIIVQLDDCKIVLEALKSMMVWICENRSVLHMLEELKVHGQ